MALTYQYVAAIRVLRNQQWLPKHAVVVEDSAIKAFVARHIPFMGLAASTFVEVVQNLAAAQGLTSYVDYPLVATFEATFEVAAFAGTVEPKSVHHELTVMHTVLHITGKLGQPNSSFIATEQVLEAGQQLDLTFLGTLKASHPAEVVDLLVVQLQQMDHQMAV